MPKIALLPPNLINQIAAGEVIERPASVLKELVENSLDAGATIIEVVLKRAGREFISVADNGCGMEVEDAQLCLERHATSKIKSFDDLLKVSTMGFRGEALPSIGSISYFNLKTRTENSDTAYEIRIEGGKKTYEGPCSGNVGTTITVEHLFYNVPARRKFLKSDATEMGQCIDLLKAIALCNTKVGFKLVDGKRVIMDLPSNQNLKERLESLFQDGVTDPLLEVRGYEGCASLEGYLSPIGLTHPTRQKIFFFVNRRTVDSKIFHQALREVYGVTMSRGHYPAAFLFLNLPPEEIDVNVHPAKREIRFRDERGKLAFLINALRASLNSSLKPQGAHLPFGLERTLHNGLPYIAPTTNPYSNFNEAYIPFSPPPLQPTPAPFGLENINNNSNSDFDTLARTAALRPTPVPFDNEQTLGNIKNNLNVNKISDPLDTPVTFDSPTQTFLRVAEGKPSRHGWQFLSFLHSDWAIFSTPEGTVIVFLGAAQERIAYEKIETFVEGDKVHSQALLIPALLQLEGTLEATLLENKEFIEKQGFIVAPFGQGCYRLEAIPSWLNAESGFSGAPEKFFIEELSTLSEGALAKSDERLKHQTFARMAAKHARTPITHGELARKLIDNLLSCKNPLKSPSGAPILWQISLDELKKRFSK